MRTANKKTLPVLWAVLFLCSVPIGFGQRNLADQQLADSLYRTNQYTAAGKLYVSLYNAAEQPDEQREKNAYLAAKSFHRSGNQEEAMVWYQKASEGFRTLKKWDNYHIAQGQLADIYDDRGAYKTAIEITEKTVTYFKDQNDSTYAANLLNNLALFHYHSGAIQQSIQTYYEAIAWAGSTNNDLTAKCYNQLGNIWADDLKNEQKALGYYRQSLHFKLQSSATAKSISSAYNNIGISHKNLGNPDSALHYYRLALNYAVKSNEPAVRLNPLINIANLQKKQGDLERAIHTFKQALKVAESVSIKQQATLQINLGMCYNEMKQYHLALDHLNAAEKLTKTTGILADKRDIHHQKSVAYFGLKNYEKAYEERANASSLNDSLYQRERQQRLADLAVKYETLQKDKTLLEQRQVIQQKELDLRKRTTLLIVAVGCFLLITAVFYFLFKRKQFVAQRTALELKLAAEQQRARINEERLRISRELHDNIGSYLTLMNASVEQLPELSPGEMTAQLPDLQKTLSLSMRELRKTVWLLNNQEITIDAITLRIRDFFKPLHQNGTKIRVQSEGDTERVLTDIQATHLFRIIQEAVTNAYKHAGATNIDIHLNSGENMCFSIVDDGQGFDVSADQQGNGLQNMRARMRDLNGTIHIESKSGMGTKVEGCF